MRYVIVNRFGAARRMVWTEIGGRAAEGETGYRGLGLLMSPLEIAEFSAMEAEGRRSAFLSDRVLTIQKEG